MKKFHVTLLDAKGVKLCQEELQAKTPRKSIMVSTCLVASGDGHEQQ
jgi:hypothetical protein